MDPACKTILLASLNISLENFGDLWLIQANMENVLKVIKIVYIVDCSLDFVSYHTMGMLYKSHENHSKLVYRAVYMRVRMCVCAGSG